MSQSSELYACLYAREFPAQALLRLRPALSKRPCVVMAGEPPLQQVCSLTRKARHLGLTHGMTQVEVDTFSDVTVLQRSPVEEVATRKILLECAGCFTPRVEDISRDKSFLCVLDLAGTRALFGTPDILMRSLLSRIGALGITACAAVSNNFHASIALTRSLQAHTVSIVPAGEQCAALAPLPLRVLDLTEAQASTLSLWGIVNLGMLAELPERELISRLGQAGKHLRQLARGEAPHLFQPLQPAFSLQEHMELDAPLEVLESLMFVANLMLEQLALRASARVLALASVSLTLRLEGNAVHTRVVRPALPSNDRPLWLKLLHLDLEAHPPIAAVLAITLEAEPGSTSQVQLGLFSPQLPEPSRLDVTLARLRSIVGDENVGSPALVDSHQLDAFRMEPFKVPSAQLAEAPSAPLRPAMRHLRPAEALFITLQSDRPSAFTFRETHYFVECAYGPWRTSGEWWSSTLWGAEQWDLVARAPDAAMLCCCVVHDLLRGHWQMAALYD